MVAEVGSNDHLQRLLDGAANVVLLETTRPDADNARTMLFANPVAVLSLHKSGDARQFFAKIEAYLAQGYYLAGYFNYEFGHLLEATLKVPEDCDQLAWFGVYSAPEIYPAGVGSFGFGSGERHWRLDQVRLNLTPETYLQRIAAIKAYLTAGDSYQVNFTGKYKFHFDGDVLGLYQYLRNKQPVAYSALIITDVQKILSFSPELFFARRQRQITVKPMKGTAVRGKTLADDERQAALLAADEKNRAENLMIVDLLRNDLGKICELGSVRVAKMFEVERYRTLLQMTSTIKGELRPGLNYWEIIKSLFPCGSVTGAPKIRTMAIIDELETESRGIYTGSIGYFGPDQEAVFNVAIRTLAIRGGHGEMGVGGGIVFDSVPEDEYGEACLKARFLTQPDIQFQLLEALLWDGSYRFLEAHLMRLNQSAQYFEFTLDVVELKEQLCRNEAVLSKDQVYKIRLELDRTGCCKVENLPLLSEAGGGEQPAVICAKRCGQSDDVFLYHKTTRRGFYEEMLHKARARGFFDLLFINERDEVAEGAISNVFAVKDGRWVTPPVASGLLAGIYRQHILNTYAHTEERVLKESDLRDAEALYLCNSVRGLVKVRLETGIFCE